MKLTILLVITTIIFSTSYSLLSAYTSGDQIAYRRFYELAADTSFLEVGQVALLTVSSAEPLTWMVYWIGANLGFAKDIWFSIINTFLALALILLLKKHKTPIPIIFLVLTNFYIIVILTSAERLKIAYLILFLAYLIDGRWQKFLLLLTPLAHLQSFIMLAGLISGGSADSIKQLVTSGKFRRGYPLKVGLILVSGSLFGFLLFEALTRKFYDYSERDISILSLTNMAILAFASLVVSRNKFRIIMALLPLMFGALILGSERINMIATTLILGLLMYERRLKHPIVILLLMYLSIKSIPFVGNIYEFGNGFEE